MVLPIIIYGAVAGISALLGAGGVIVYDKLSSKEKKELDDLKARREKLRRELEEATLIAQGEMDAIEQQIRIKRKKIELLRVEIEEAKLQNELAEEQRKQHLNEQSYTDK